MIRIRGGGLVLALVIMAGCGTPATTRSPSGPSGVASAGQTTAPPTQVQPTGSPGSTVPAAVTDGTWVDAGSLALGRARFGVGRLPDGRVMVVGNDQVGCVRDDSVESEIWDPASGAWTPGPDLNKPRAEFAAVPAAGGMLVAGGVNAGVADADGNPARHQAFSSAYRVDPAGVDDWVRAGLLDQARVAPLGAPLLDGRVLVAGGFYLSGDERSTGSRGALPGVALAAYRPDPSGASPSRVPLTDVDVPPMVKALATAELYDPVGDVWSATGPMRFARVDPATITLADGRVLVVGSQLDFEESVDPEPSRWNGAEIVVDDRARATAEVYDPATGRFALTGKIPTLSWASLDPVWAEIQDSLGSAQPPTEGYDERTSSGVPVALADGGALLVGRGTRWTGWLEVDPGEVVVQVVQTLRLDPGSLEWRVVDSRAEVRAGFGPSIDGVAGHSREGAAVARLPDGSVLIAGGLDPATREAVATVERYDPATDAWSTLPPMPAPRLLGTAVALADGSVLVIGGMDALPDQGADRCADQEPGMRSTVRFVPGS